jgi:hypothetical protein
MNANTAQTKPYHDYNITGMGELYRNNITKT